MPLYETKQDLLDISIPFFRAGLEKNEFCLWIVADPLNEEQAQNALRQAFPARDRYWAAGLIELVSYSDWYLANGSFVPGHVINSLEKKLAARPRGSQVHSNVFS